MSQQAAVEESLESLVARLADEFAERLERGERPDPNEYANRYPEQASVIRQVLSCLNLVRLSAPSTAAQANDAELHGTLGDYRLIREIGRGGMGVVYEAEQVSLGRHVALKVLPFAAALDERQLQRFRNEAHAAAQLHHTNIVPVHAVGFERGVHFYAMQYIDGCTLGDVIRDLRKLSEPASTPAVESNADWAPSSQIGSSRGASETSNAAAAMLSTERSSRSPGFIRTVANLAVHAAEALEHAHQAGVIHRDIKPSNLLIDSRGHVWVTDFGLALIQGDAKLTMTGDIVGTLRYMSPEQALGQREPLDQRTDIYSLGATLYELLTLTPVFAGQDRKELLRQIAFEEPKTPRRVNRAIPSELETIVLKALAKVPGERYVSAQEVADDLRRFLNDQTIRAKRPGIVLRMRKWARRHRPVVWAATVVGLMALVLGGAAGGWYLQERAARRVAFARDVEARCTEAQILAAEAERVRDKPAQWQALLTGARSALSRAETLMAGKEELTPAELRDRVKRLRGELDAEEFDRQLLAEVEEARLRRADEDARGDQFEFEPLLRSYAEAFDRYGMRVGETPPDKAGASIRARPAPIAARIIAALDEWLAFAAVNEQGWLRRVLAAADADLWRTELRALVVSGNRDRLLQLALEPSVVEQPAQSICRLTMVLAHCGPEGATASVALLERAHARHPADFWIIHDLAFALSNLQPPRPEEAVRYYTAAMALRPESPGAWLNFGIALRKSRRLQEAVAAHRKAIELQPEYVAAYNCLGMTFRDMGKFDEASDAFRTAIRLEPNSETGHNNLGTALFALKKEDNAVAAFREAVRLQPNFAMGHSNLGNALRLQGKLEEAVAACRRAVAANPTYQGGHINLGSALYDQKKFAAAADAYREALKLNPGSADAAFSLGNALRLDNRYGEAVAAYDMAIRAEPNDARFHRSRASALLLQGLLSEAITANREAIRLEPNSANGHFNLGNALRDRGALEEAAACFREAIRLKPDLADAWCNLGKVLGLRGEFLDGLAALRRGHELGQKTPGWSYSSASAVWVKLAERKVELDKRLPRIMSGDEKPANADERLEFAVCLYRKRLYATASRFFSETFVTHPAYRINRLFDAESAFVLAGCGQGGDAVTLTEADRARYRRQALDWLRSNVETWTRHLDSELPQMRARGERLLRQMRYHADFDPIRDIHALAKLPETERKAWQQLWIDVDKAIAKAASSTTSTKSSNKQP